MEAVLKWSYVTACKNAESLQTKAAQAYSLTYCRRKSDGMPLLGLRGFPSTDVQAVARNSRYSLGIISFKAIKANQGETVA